MRRFRLALLGFSAVFLLGADCNILGPSRARIRGSLVAEYGQGRINGRTLLEISRETSVSGQVGGTLCLFEGGQYSYTARYSYWNTAVKGDRPDQETFYGTYMSPSPAIFEFTERLTGTAELVDGVLTLGNNTFGRNDPPSTCETLR